MTGVGDLPDEAPVVHLVENLPDEWVEAVAWEMYDHETDLLGDTWDDARPSTRDAFRRRARIGIAMTMPRVRAHIADEIDAAAKQHHARICEIAGVSIDRSYGMTADGIRRAARIVRTGSDDLDWERVDRLTHRGGGDA